MEIRKATQYPTRYDAFDSPGILFEAAERKHSGGFEAAVFHQPMQNERYSHLTDGVYAEIISYQGGWWLASISATRPNSDRTQKGWRCPGRPTDYEEAKRWLLATIPDAVAWATGRV